MAKYPFKDPKPFAHQVRGIKRLIRDGHLALLWEVGTAKTRTIVDAACVLYLKKRVKRVLVVCPMSVLGVWEDQFAEFATVPYQLQIYDKRWDKLTWHPSNPLKVLVMNYDIGWRRKPIVKKFKPDFVIADESHRIKKPGTKRSFWLRSLNKSPYRAILTGTPTPKSLLDLYGQWVFLNPKRFGTQKKEFQERYIIYGGYMGYQIKGYRNLKELKRKVKADAMVIKKDKVLDLPPATHQRVPVVLEDTAAKMYERMAYDLFVDLEDGEVVDAKTVATKILKLQQITGGFVFTESGEVRQVSRAKLDVLRDLLEDRFEFEQRVIVFCRFLPELHAIKAIGANMKVPVYALHGDVKEEVRRESVRMFQKLEGPSLFVAQIQTGGLGINLQKASEAIFYSVTFALDDYLQSLGRLHRQGQKNKVTYRHLVARKSVDLDIYAALKRKEDVTKLILDDPDVLRKYYVV